jgi:hypothetical protein
MASTDSDVKMSGNGIREEHIEQSTHHQHHVAIHTDTYDIDEDALGNNLPKNYYMSPGFIGTVIVSCSPLLFILCVVSDESNESSHRHYVSATSPTT